jgi:16S rRNA (cytosine967-C5)-methyltransferase
VRKKGQAAGSGFVNGILRSIARRAEYFAKPDKDKNPSEYLSLQYAHPQWIVQRWSRSFNFEKMREILSSNNQVPPYTVRVNSLKVPAEQLPEFRTLLLKEERNASERRALRSCLHLKDSPSFAEGSLFQRGYFTVQDESSQLISHLVDPKEGETIVDACAGKGGKTGHLYELGEGKITLIAMDKNAEQLKLGRESMQRMGHEKITFLESDFLDYRPEQAPDKILLDAPCSGLGVLRRHPEGKWQKTLAILPILARQQRALIEHAFEILKPGGELVYSVCSFETEEILDHLDWATKHYGKKLELVSPVSRLPDYYKRFVTRENVLLVYSGNKDAMDGFGAFILRKVL